MKVDTVIKAYPDIVGFLIGHGLPCVVCGEPFWGTLAELARQKGFSDEQIDEIVEEFNKGHRN